MVDSRYFTLLYISISLSSKFKCTSISRYFQHSSNFIAALSMVLVTTDSRLHSKMKLLMIKNLLCSNEEGAQSGYPEEHLKWAFLRSGLKDYLFTLGNFR